MTELETSTVSRKSANKQTHGAGELRSVITNNDENWRAALAIDIEASDQESVEETAEKIVKALSEIGEIEKL